MLPWFPPKSDRPALILLVLIFGVSGILLSVMHVLARQPIVPPPPIVNVQPAVRITPPLLSARPLQSIPYQQEKIQMAHVALPWVENRGQFASRVRYRAQTSLGNVFANEQGLTYTFEEPAATSSSSVQASVIQKKPTSIKRFGFAIRETLVGAGLVAPQAKDKGDAPLNIFLGKDASRWQKNIPTWKAISYEEAKTGISLAVYAEGQGIEKKFTIPAGQDVSKLAVRFSGPRSFRIEPDGSLLLILDEQHQVAFTKPQGFQQIGGVQKEVDVAYVKKGQLTYGFSATGADPAYPLLIDPILDTLAFSTFLGGSGRELVTDIARDASGNIYVYRTTNSGGFPTTVGAYSVINSGSNDAFITKFNANLSQILASTLIGGSSEDELNTGVIDDAAGYIYLNGYTNSADFPTTAGAYDTSHNGGYDGFVIKMTLDLTTLASSTYLGGSLNDFTFRLLLDGAGSLYVAGRTAAADFPTTAGAYDTSFNGGGSDGFVSKLNTALTALSASTFVGSTGFDEIQRIARSSTGQIYAVGDAVSGFPTTVGAYDTSQNGVEDAFVLSLNPSLSTLNASTFIGGSLSDYGLDIALDANDQVFVTGRTTSVDFPATVSAYDTTFNGGAYDTFLAQFNTGLTALNAATYFGGSGVDYGRSIALDAAGSVWLIGYSDSANIPVTAGAYDTTPNGLTDAMISKWSSDVSTLIGSTVVGGAGNDSSWGLVLGATNQVYVTGDTSSSDFPVTSGAYDTSYNGDTDDVFVLRMEMSVTPSPFIPTAHPNLQLQVRASPDILPAAGGTSTLTYTVYNGGDTPLENVQILDAVCASPVYVSGDMNANAAFDRGEMWIFMCQTMVTQPTVDFIRARGEGAGVAVTDAVLVSFDMAPPDPGIPRIRLMKIPDLIAVPEAGLSTVFTYLVTNSGTVPLDHVWITDNACTEMQRDFGDHNQNNLLDPEEIWRFTCRAYLLDTASHTATVRGEAQGQAVTDTVLTTVVGTGIPAHTLLQTLPEAVATSTGNRTVYYVGTDKKRHAFINEKIYYSWYCDFSGVQIISAKDLARLPLGKNVPYRPHARLVKFPSAPEVYAVEIGSILRHVPSQEIAAWLFGSDWQKKVDDLPDVYAGDYIFGEPLTSFEQGSASSVYSVVTPSDTLFPPHAVTSSVSVFLCQAKDLARQIDSEGDGLNDARERERGTDPWKRDTDDDGLTDAEETLLYKTNPLNKDTDGDRISDLKEMRSGTNPRGRGVCVNTRCLP